MVGFTFVWIDKLRNKAFYGCKWGTVEEADRSGYVGFNNALVCYLRSFDDLVNGECGLKLAHRRLFGCADLFILMVLLAVRTRGSETGDVCGP
jgi:hypothetical protein